MHEPSRRRRLLLLCTALTYVPLGLSGQDLPTYLRDRGTGIPLSQFGTYIRPGELVVYPFYEYYYDHNREYEPHELGIIGDTRELRGRYEAHEGLVFLAYGISDRLAIEIEAGVISAQLDKSGDDDSQLPERVEASGLSDVEGQIRWRWNRESPTSPEYFNYLEIVGATGEKHSLIGTSAWEYKLGFGAVKGLGWGTVTGRAAVEYDTDENAFGVGEFALEYLRRVSDRFRLFGMVEGSEDEISLIPEVQGFLSSRVLLKVAAGVGLTSKATDFEPEIGVMFRLR